MAPLKYSGSCMFRQRIVASILSNSPLKIDKIRENHAEFPGLQDFEANFLRLIEAMTDGSKIEINETGTILRFKPGILVGGRISHDCSLSRSIGWFIEGILPLAPFCKDPLHLQFTGITHDEIDMSVDILRAVTFPLLQNFGIFNVEFRIKKRGVPPKGGGLVELSIPITRGSLQSVYLIDEGLIKRVRGLAFCTRISPTIITRVVDSCRGVLNDYLPDVHISTDHFKGGKDGGDSPGYSISLVAETTTGALLSIERTAKCRRDRAVPGMLESSNQNSNHEREAPEDVGKEAAQMLLEEIFSGGIVDRMHQPLILQLMVLTPEDVSKVRFGSLTPQAMEALRIIRDAFGIVFRIQEEKETLPETSSAFLDRKENSEDDEDNMDDDDDDEEQSNEGDDSDNSKSSGDEDDESMDIEDNSSVEEGTPSSNNVVKDRETYLLSCLGTGYTNVNRRVT